MTPPDQCLGLEAGGILEVGQILDLGGILGELHRAEVAQRAGHRAEADRMLGHRAALREGTDSPEGIPNPEQELVQALPLAGKDFHTLVVALVGRTGCTNCPMIQWEGQGFGSVGLVGFGVGSLVAELELEVVVGVVIESVGLVGLDFVVVEAGL